MCCWFIWVCLCVLCDHPRPHKTRRQRRVSWYVRAHITCASHTYIMFHHSCAWCRLAVRALSPTAGTGLQWRYRDIVVDFVAISRSKKVHDSSPSDGRFLVKVISVLQRKLVEKCITFLRFVVALPDKIWLFNYTLIPQLLNSKVVHIVLLLFHKIFDLYWSLTYNVTAECVIKRMNKNIGPCLVILWNKVIVKETDTRVSF